jgi:hypothetical protein
MRGKYLRRLGSFLLAALLLPGVITLFSSTTAQAQRRVSSCEHIVHSTGRFMGIRFGIRTGMTGTATTTNTFLVVRTEPQTRAIMTV